jgi:hypothetical protein
MIGDSVSRVPLVAAQNGVEDNKRQMGFPAKGLRGRGTSLSFAMFIF